MVKFVCDNKDIEKALRRLHKQVLANGGLVYDGLTMGAKNGSFIITCDDKIAAGERIMVLPRDCLLPVDRFDLGLKGDTIIIKGHDKDLTKGQVAMMETMMELYNLTGKIRQQKKTGTLGIYYSDKVLFDLVFQKHSRSGTAFLERMIAADKKNFPLESFLKTRVLGLRGDAKDVGKEAAKEGKGGDRVKVLMPLIDFLNHHPGAPGFFTSFRNLPSPGDKIAEGDEDLQGEDGVAVFKSCPMKGSQECFVSYGPYDAWDTLISYNYIEAYTRFVRSVPLEIKVPGVGTLKINSVPGMPDHKDLPEKIKDLRFYLPAIRSDVQKKTVILSHLFIPQEQAPRALRRVLAFALLRTGVKLNDEMLREAVEFAEQRVVAENLKYYKDLLKALGRHKPEPQAKIIYANIQSMAKAQLENIDKYPMMANLKADRPKRKARA